MAGRTLGTGIGPAPVLGSEMAPRRDVGCDGGFVPEITATPTPDIRAGRESVFGRDRSRMRERGFVPERVWVPETGVVPD